MRIFDATYPEIDSGRACTPCDHDATRNRAIQPQAVARGSDLDGAVYHRKRRGNPGLVRHLHSTPTRFDRGITTTNSKRSSRSATKRRMRSLVCLSLLAQPAAAVLLDKFDNCLPDSTKYSNPLELQWVPLYVGATFDTKNKSHNLRITVWGNVTGRYNPTATPELPPWNSDDWSNPNVTDGKIVDNPFADTANLLTTLHSKIDVVTYEPYSADFDFCKDALTNASCPLGPVFNTSEITSLAGLPSITMTKDFYSSYAFTSFSPTFSIIYGDVVQTTVGCISATLTPDLGGLAWMLKFLPLMVLLSVGFATVFASIYSPWGTTDIFHWSSNFGRHNDLLRLVTPGFGDCLQYIQFVALTGGLTLNYPGFFQPIVSQASWSALMFNQSFVTKDPGWQNLRDGLYFTNGTYGLHELGQLVGMGNVEDIWAGMMVWLLGIIGAVAVITQLGFAVQWVYRFVKNVQEEDLRNKNLPFTVGNVVRIVFNFFLLPLVALSMFQLVVAAQSPAYTVALAAATIVLLLIFAGWLLRLITTTKPRSVLFDDLPTVLLYGPLYNTYSDEAAAFALIPVLLTFIRGVGIGAVQPVGIAQIIVLAICEVVQVITLHAFKPFSSPTSMNAYHTLFAVLRFTVILLMTAFIPQLGVTDGSKGWIGYVILVIHSGVLVLCFMLNALQTIIEVIARLMGAGGDDNKGLSQGPLSRIFGARQLSRRTSRRGGPSRQSQLSSTAMLSAQDPAQAGYIAPSGRLRSESAGSVVLLNGRPQRSSSALDAMSFDNSMPPSRLEAGTTFTPSTPGETSTYSFLPSPVVGQQSRHSVPPNALVADNPGDTFYRPPRKRGKTLDNQSPHSRARASWGTSGEWSQKRTSQSGGAALDPVDVDPIDRDRDRDRATPATYAFPTRTDYATREVDFYYGVQRGSRLNSDAPQRKLGTGPADPTGTVATATGWFKNMFSGKRKEKGKGFEVVRSSRMPPAMRSDQAYDDTDPPEGTPVAMGVLRKGPIDSDSDEGTAKRPPPAAQGDEPPPTARLLNDDGVSIDEDAADEPGDLSSSRNPPVLPDLDAGGSFHVPSRAVSKTSHASERIDVVRGDIQKAVPDVPRKSSRRKSDLISGLTLNLDAPPPRGQDQATSSRLPFQPLSRNVSADQRTSSISSLGAESDTHQLSSENRLGTVTHGSINRFPSDSRGKIEGSSAEFVDR
ncbi:hypothetical protein J7T55_008745 [Diaporthe amygdali]|uniref:uncharacterized protein n=1 Tax=Phomopsis amygdali TaxID=1214568 RepID=UPI0022FEDE16|nr:uncharacterized protein J7T55_008745 [Diaporthe amygdali]KAJ0121580.1 hypothetical protein J7T55_008745 [Diaporthe amygdali]